MTYAASDMATILINNWSLTGTASITATPTMAEPVWIFGHPKIGGLDYTKLVYIYKVNQPENENQINHPKWIEYRDVYRIIAEYRVLGTDDTDFDLAQSDMESICGEITRILKTQFDPTKHVGVFMQSNYQWTIDDQFTGDSPQLVRSLTLTLTEIKSELTTVYTGYGGVLAFDITNSQGSNLPVSNYTYTEAWDVQIDQGYNQIEEFVSQNPNNTGVPIFFRTIFQGSFVCKIKAKRADIGTNNTNALNLIWQLYTNNELPKVYLIWTVPDTTTPTAHVLTVSTPMYVRKMRQSYNVEQIAEFILEARVAAPSTISTT